MSCNLFHWLNTHRLRTAHTAWDSRQKNCKLVTDQTVDDIPCCLHILYAFKLGSLAGLFFVVIDLCERRIAALNLAALRTRCSLKTFSSNWETGTETTVLFNIPCPFCIWWLPRRANPPRFTIRSSSQTSLLKIYKYRPSIWQNKVERRFHVI